MKGQKLLAQMEAILDNAKEIPTEKKYWLIRTQSGEYYESFKDFGYVAIEHEKVSLYDIKILKEKAAGNKKMYFTSLKAVAAKKYPDELRPGLIANQLIKFVDELKRGDTVIIPSWNSGFVTIGTITSTAIPNVTKEDIEKTGCPYFKRKHVKWIKTIDRDDLDPFLYRMLQAHQAINNISDYADIIERTINNFYIQNEEANLVLEVQQTGEINARQLFSLGHNLLEYAQQYFDENDLPLSVDDIEVKITLNSPGKLQLKGSKAATIWIIALLVVGINGGGLKIHVSGFNLDLTTPGAVSSIIDYQNNKHDRASMDTLLKKSMDTLKVKSPDDAVKLLKQVSTNKDKPE